MNENPPAPRIESAGPASGHLRLRITAFQTKMFGWLFSWRLVRFVGFCVVCLATLVGLFYAEENARGRWAWHRFKRTWEAKGEKFDVRGFIPPPVPDDQNFAQTPLLKPLLEYEIRDGRTLWRDTNGWQHAHDLGAPQPQDLHVPPPGIAGLWNQGHRIDLAAWLAYYHQDLSTAKGSRASRRLGASRPTPEKAAPAPISPKQVGSEVLQALSPFDPALEQLRLASALPASRFAVHYEEGWAARLPHLALLKKIAQLAILRAVAELEADRSQEALQDTRLSFAMARAIQSEPFVISHLVRVAILEQTLQAIWEGLARHRWSPEQIAVLSAELKQRDLLSDYVRAVQADLSLGTMSETFSDPGRIEPLLKDMVPGEYIPVALIPTLRYGPKGWLYLNDTTRGRYYLEELAPSMDAKEHRAYPSVARAAIQKFESKRLGPDNFLIKSVLSWFGCLVMPQSTARGQAAVDLARVGCALELYWHQHGRYPESLAVLGPASLEPLPHDLISGQPLHYRPTTDGRFVLYSVGWDEKDDGGIFPTTVARQSRVNWGSNLDETGDWVWQYPAEN